MAIKKIELSEDALKLISNITFESAPEPLMVGYEAERREQINYYIDLNSLYGGSYVFEDIAFILGRENEMIPGTEENPLGGEFPEEFENYMWNLHTYIVDNLEYIEQMVHQFCIKGGLKPGKYECKSNVGIWEYKGE